MSGRGVTYSDPALAGGFGIVYRNFMRCANISMQAKSVYCYLVSFAGQTGKAFPSQSTMCQELGITKPTLRKYISELVSAGAITVQTDPENPFHRSHRYFINSGFSLEVKKNNPQREKIFHLEGKKLTPINNLNNNQNKNQGADGQIDRPAAHKQSKADRPKTLQQTVWEYWDRHYPDHHNGEQAIHNYPAEAKAIKKLEGQPWPEIRASIDRFFRITPHQDKFLHNNQRVLIFVQNYQNRLLQKARASQHADTTSPANIQAALEHDEQLRQQQLQQLREQGVQV